MKQNQIIRKIVDAVLTVLLLCLMAYQVTGEALHEWIGVGMTVMLIVHHILNIRWYGSLFKGRYNAWRIVTITVNMLLLASIALTAFCGMSMSAHATPFLYGMVSVSFARRMHLAFSFWSFILMGLHLGLHVPAMTAKLKPGRPVKTILPAVLTVLAGIGLWLLIRNGIPDYIFFRTPFAFLDYEKAPVLVFLENLAQLFFFAFVGANTARLIRRLNKKNDSTENPLIPILYVLIAILIGVIPNLMKNNQSVSPGWGASQNTSSVLNETNHAEEPASNLTSPKPHAAAQIDPNETGDGFILIPGGTFLMGSPETENWRIDDETQHEVTLSSFYIDPHETTQAEYTRLMGENPSSFTGGDLPVESISWLDALRFANARSTEAGLTPVYTFSENSVAWDRAADGYRLPTEAEWEYACRAGTDMPFNAGKSLDADHANFYGHYPYEIEENYFNDSVLEARPGLYRQTTVPVGSFYKNKWGLYDMHGNVNEWCWDYYGAYDLQPAADPTGIPAGARHVYRGGGWNDFGKNMRSAYRAAAPSALTAANLGMRLARNANAAMTGTVTAVETVPPANAGGKILIAFFSWGGNTRGIAREIQAQTGADLFEITLTHPYSTSYNTVLMEAQADQRRQARPEIANPLQSIDQYDVILLGYPNWWASIPMPVATFLESYDFSGKTILPFCSHGGGRFGQSLTAIAKLAPDSELGEGLSIHYSGGSTLPSDVSAWLDRNGIDKK
mgnify:FL=1